MTMEGRGKSEGKGREWVGGRGRGVWVSVGVVGSGGSCVLPEERQRAALIALWAGVLRLGPSESGAATGEGTRGSDSVGHLARSGRGRNKGIRSWRRSGKIGALLACQQRRVAWRAAAMPSRCRPGERGTSPRQTRIWRELGLVVRGRRRSGEIGVCGDKDNRELRHCWRPTGWEASKAGGP